MPPLVGVHVLYVRQNNLMKIFISWSGIRSRAVAEFLREWIKCVLQSAKPWISSRDLDRGAVWFTEIGGQLKDTSVGIICLTAANKDKPWILFEAGALAKGLSTTRVCTLLVDLKPEDVEDPLAQFNHTMPNKQGVLSLVETLNAALGDGALDQTVLEKVFTTYWPQFEESFAKILKKTEGEEAAPPRDDRDMLAEILSHTRSLSTRISRLESGYQEQVGVGSQDTRGQEHARQSPTMIYRAFRQYLSRGLTQEEAVDRLVKRGNNPELVMHALHNHLARYPETIGAKKEE